MMPSTLSITTTTTLLLLLVCSNHAVKLRGQPAPNAAAGAAPNAAAGAAPNVAAGAAPNPLGAVRNAAFAAPNADLQQIARQFGANQALNTLAQRASLRSRIMVRTLCTRYLAGHVTFYS